MGGVTYIFLYSGQLNDTLVDRALRDQSVDGDLARLTQTVGTVHCLRVVGRVPVMVVEDDGVRGSEVDTQTTSAGTEDENENIGPMTII